MSKRFKPMLASTEPVDPDELEYPVYATPKLDGVRALIRDGQVVQRSLKPVRNQFIQDELAGLPDGLDGELTVGLDFHKSSGDIRREEGEPDFTYWVFDCVQADPSVPYTDRLKLLDGIDHERVRLVLPVRVDTADELRELVGKWTDEGYEGGMVRTADSPYKYGRSTRKEGWLLKIKDFVDTEAEIIDVYELMRNENEAKTNLLGRTERSSHKENLVPSGLLGGFVLRHPDWEDFRCGSFKGVTHEERKEMWEAYLDDPSTLIGQLAKFKYQPHGSQERPRLPIFLGLRDPDDS